MSSKINRIAVAAASVVAVALSAAPVAGAAQTCMQPGAQQIVQDKQVRVFVKNHQGFGCLRSNGRVTRLKGTSDGDLYAVAGEFVGFTSGPNHSVADVINARTRSIPRSFPFETNDPITGIVVTPKGAAAWAAQGTDGTYIQGTDRRNHEPDQLSDDTRNVFGVSLNLVDATHIDWSYTDGTHGSATLY
jgi:hypothetical protein